MRPMALRCAAAAAAVAAASAGAGPLVVGDICYRFCEDDSEELVNRRSDCPADAPCGAPPDLVGFDSCGDFAETCGGGAGANFTEGGEDGEVHMFGYGKELKQGGEEGEARMFGYGKEPKKSSEDGEARILEAHQKRRLRQGSQSGGGAPRLLSDEVVECGAGEQDPRAECCELEDSQCWFKSIDAPNDGCSPACERRYQTLPYQCYEDFKMHQRFVQMMRNCDPRGVYKWRGPTTTRPMRAFNVNEQQQPAVASQAAASVARNVLPMVVASVVSLTLLCLA